MVRIHPRPPFFLSFAGMAELADALDSGSSESNFMQVQVLFPAPAKSLENIEFSGLFLCLFALITLYSSIAYPLTVQA